jgi:hypothetical protein
MARVSITELEDLNGRAHSRNGYNIRETEAILEVLLYAQLNSFPQAAVLG